MSILNKSRGFARRVSRAGRGFARRSRRGSIATFAAMSIPPLILMAGMGIDEGYLVYRHRLLQQTVQAAALAGQASLASYYSLGNGSTYSATTMATIDGNLTTIVHDMMPTARFGTVVPTPTVYTPAGNAAAMVELGTWNNVTNTFTATTTNPTAVQVSGSNTVNTFFGGLINRPNVAMSASAVASYGNGLSGAGGFNTIILNDLSMSFSSEIPDQRAADIAILNCISAGSNGNAKVGLTSFDGDPKMQNAAGVSGFPIQVNYVALPYVPYTIAGTLIPVLSAYSGTLVKSTSANVAAMTSYINSTLNYCGNSGMPTCSGSNVAAGLYSAIQQLQAASLAGNQSNIILITDGVPNADARTYTTLDGMSATPSSTINAKYSFSGCTTSCNDTDLWAGAQAWAAYAGSLGINVSTVYYSGDTSGSGNISTYSADLASLVQGNGMALVAPSASNIDSAFATFCASMGSAVKMAH